MSFPAKSYDSLTLANASIAYANKKTDYIADLIAPNVKVAANAPSGKIASYGAEMIRLVETRKADRGKYNKATLEITRSTHYYIEEHGLTEDVFEADVRKSGKAIRAQTDATQHVTQLMMVSREYAVSSALRDTSVLTQNTTLSGSSQWSHADGNPFNNFKAANEAIFAGSGVTPNTLILGREAWNALQFNAAVRAAFPGAQMISLKMIQEKLGALFGYDHIYVGKGKYNAANKGQAKSLTSFWGDDAVVCYTESAPTLKSVSLVKSYVPEDRPTYTVSVHPQNVLGKEAIEAEIHSMVKVKRAYDTVIMDALCGYLIKDVN